MGFSRTALKPRWAKLDSIDRCQARSPQVDPPEYKPSAFRRSMWEKSKSPNKGPKNRRRKTTGRTCGNHLGDSPAACGYSPGNTLRLPADDEKYKLLPHRQPWRACSCPPAKARPRKRPMPGRHPIIMMLNQHERGQSLGDEVFHILAGCDRTWWPEIAILPFFLSSGCDQTSTDARPKENLPIVSDLKERGH